MDARPGILSEQGALGSQLFPSLTLFMPLVLLGTFPGCSVGLPAGRPCGELLGVLGISRHKWAHTACWRSQLAWHSLRLSPGKQETLPLCHPVPFATLGQDSVYSVWQGVSEGQWRPQGPGHSVPGGSTTFAKPLASSPRFSSPPPHWPAGHMYPL